MTQDEGTPLYAGGSDLWRAVSAQAGSVIRLGMTLEELRGAAWEAAESLARMVDEVERAWQARDIERLRSRELLTEVVLCITVVVMMGDILGEQWTVDTTMYDGLEVVLQEG